ncbi:MAG TPA: rhomboid family intramembrane serine protease [Actinomycetales bacterium]|nr:rhomboid family intramembrane serine protease [Actinomycetales bacterium]
MSEAGARGVMPVPVCPRHPDRESYVRCQRCERPTCAECQRDAAVGIQCVDCVRESAQGVREARTAFGGRVGDGRPLVTYTVIGACVVTFVLQLASPAVTSALAFAPALAESEPWRFVTSAFLHSTGLFFHILLNMYALWLIGPYLESLFGRARFAAFYLTSAIGGSVGFLLLAEPVNQFGQLTSTVGASGAVFGLFGALVIVQRKLGRDLGQILVLIGINTVLGFVIPNIAWQAHLGGLVTGVAVAAALAYAPRERRTAVQTGGLALVVVLLLAAAVLGLSRV